MEITFQLDIYDEINKVFILTKIVIIYYIWIVTILYVLIAMK